MYKIKGFTLIELMVVLAIIGVLSAIAFPAYRGYMVRVANNACLAEAKGYTMSVFVAVTDGDSNTPQPELSACAYITNANTLTDLSITSVIEALPRAPGDQGVRCNLNANSSCMLDSSVTP